jgi:hypothetical protein
MGHTESETANRCINMEVDVPLDSGVVWFEILAIY